MRIGGAEAEKFFRWTMIDPKNYFLPSELNYFCKQADGSNSCRFPQDLRSQSYWSKKILEVERKILQMYLTADKNLPSEDSYKFMYHPYIYGIQGSAYPEIDVGKKYDESWVCGTIREVLKKRKEIQANIFIFNRLLPTTRKIEQRRQEPK